MKIMILGILIAASALPLLGDTQPTAFEKALYDKARNQILCETDDDDFVAYCTTMDFGGDTLLKLHDQILFKQTELGDLLKQGLTSDNPQVIALDAVLADLRSELAIKVVEARKALAVEAKVADATLSALSQYQK